MNKFPFCDFSSLYVRFHFSYFLFRGEILWEWLKGKKFLLIDSLTRDDFLFIKQEKKSPIHKNYQQKDPITNFKIFKTFQHPRKLQQEEEQEEEDNEKVREINLAICCHHFNKLREPTFQNLKRICK